MGQPNRQMLHFPQLSLWHRSHSKGCSNVNKEIFIHTEQERKMVQISEREHETELHRESVQKSKCIGCDGEKDQQGSRDEAQWPKQTQQSKEKKIQHLLFCRSGIISSPKLSSSHTGWSAVGGRC